MNKNKANKILVPILAILMVNQILSGAFGMSLTRTAFEVLHKGGALALLVAAGLHVAVNRAWIKANYLKKPAVAR